MICDTFLFIEILWWLLWKLIDIVSENNSLLWKRSNHDNYNEILSGCYGN